MNVIKESEALIFTYDLNDVDSLKQAFNYYKYAKKII